MESDSDEEVPPLATRYNSTEEDSDNDEERKDDKGKEDEDRPIPQLIKHYKVDFGNDSVSDSESEDKKEDKDRTSTELMKMKLGFLSGRDGIFIDKNEKDDCVDDKAVTNQSNPDKNPRQTKIKKYKRNSKKKSKSSLTINPDIKYKNNKKKKRKKVIRIDSEDDDITDEEDDDPMPGLQNRSRPVSSSDDDSSDNRGDGDSGTKAS